jgi:hypothetical protein
MDVGTIGFNVTVCGIAVRRAMSPQIAGNDALVRAKKVYLGLPIVMATRIPMHKHQRRVAVSLPLIEESFPLQFQIRHAALL